MVSRCASAMKIVWSLRDLVHPSWTTSDHVFRRPAVFIELDQPGSTSAPEWSAGWKTRIVTLDQSPWQTYRRRDADPGDHFVARGGGGRCERPHCPVRWRLLAVAQRTEHPTV